MHIELVKETSLERSMTRAAKRSFGKSFKKSAGSSENFWDKKARQQTGLIPTRISGIRIPSLANRHKTKAVLGLVQIFMKDAQERELEQLGWKSYAVWLVPLLVAAFGAVLTAWPGRWAVAVPIGLLCATVAAFGTFQILSVDTRKAYSLAVGSGLWMSLASYAGLAAVAVLQLAPVKWAWRPSEAR